MIVFNHLLYPACCILQDQHLWIFDNAKEIYRLSIWECSQTCIFGPFRREIKYEYPMDGTLLWADTCYSLPKQVINLLSLRWFDIILYASDIATLGLDVIK